MISKIVSPNVSRKTFVFTKRTNCIKAKRKDANHNEIMEAILKAGIPFYDLSFAGNGVPDAIVWVKKAWQLIEIKNIKTGYGKKGLNTNQKKWISQYQGGPVYLIYNTDDVVLLVQGKLDKLVSFPPKQFLI